jgi:beta-glucosidase
MMKIIIPIAFICLATLAQAQVHPLYLDSNRPLESRVEELLSRLPLEEKVSIIHADSEFTTAAIPRLGSPVRRNNR